MLFDKGERELLLLDWDRFQIRRVRDYGNYVFLVLQREYRPLLILLFYDQ